MLDRQRIEAIAFNAVHPALAETGDWVRLTARMNVARRVLADLEAHGYRVVPIKENNDV